MLDSELQTVIIPNADNAIVQENVSMEEGSTLTNPLQLNCFYIN